MILRDRARPGAQLMDGVCEDCPICGDRVPAAEYDAHLVEHEREPPPQYADAPSWGEVHW